MLRSVQVVVSNVLSNITPVNVLIVVIIFILLVCIIINVNYFNVFQIIHNYVKLFKEKDGGYNLGALCLAFVIPLFLALVVLFSNSSKIETNISATTGPILVITILTTMFFAILSIVLQISSQIEASKKTATEKEKLKKLSDSIFYTDMFEILMCIIVLTFCFINSFMDRFVNVINFMIYWITFTVIINMLMLLKRLFVVINELIKR